MQSKCVCGEMEVTECVSYCFKEKERKEKLMCLSCIKNIICFVLRMTRRKQLI